MESDVNVFEIISKVHYANNYWIVLLPFICAFVDVVTGYIQAQINGVKNSSVMRKGLYRKFAEIIVVLFSMAICFAFEFPVRFAALVSLYVVWMEVQSIAENLKSAGVPIPAWITTKTDEINKQIEKG